MNSIIAMIVVSQSVGFAAQDSAWKLPVASGSVVDIVQRELAVPPMELANPVEISTYVVVPKLLNREEVIQALRAQYPKGERAEGREAKVKVEIRLDARGHVRDIRVLETQGKAFDRAALKVARVMRFSPAIIHEEPKASKVVRTLHFRRDE